MKEIKEGIEKKIHTRYTKWLCTRFPVFDFNSPRETVQNESQLKFAAVCEPIMFENQNDVSHREK